MFDAPTIDEFATLVWVAKRVPSNSGLPLPQKGAGMLGVVVQFQYGSAKSLWPVSLRQIDSKKNRIARCHGRNHQLPCTQWLLWISACLVQLRPSLAGSAFMAATASL